MCTRNTGTTQTLQKGIGIALLCSICRMLLLQVLMGQTFVGEHGPFLLP